jgi:(4S)-4-hydroxy-5-phosphonooxypentane-2,3-dione isomerase
MICVLVEVHVKPAKMDEFLEVIQYDAVHSEGDEPGCIRFDVLRDNDDPMKFFFYEVYRDEAARQAHRQMPHYAKWAKFKEEGFDREMVLHSTTNIHPADAGWR